MAGYAVPETGRRVKLGKKQVQLVASGDLRLSANQKCWEAQRKMEEALGGAVAEEGFSLVRAHAIDEQAGHGFIASQKQGMEVFRTGVDAKAPLVVAEAVWQYSHHVLSGLIAHKGPILTVANWSGTWPGLVGMLNLNGSLTKAGVERIGLVSQHLFSSKQTHGVFIRMDAMDETSIGKGFRELRKQKVAEESEGEGVVKELQAM